MITDHLISRCGVLASTGVRNNPSKRHYQLLYQMRTQNWSSHFALLLVSFLYFDLNIRLFFPVSEWSHLQAATGLRLQTQAPTHQVYGKVHSLRQRGQRRLPCYYHPYFSTVAKRHWLLTVPKASSIAPTSQYITWGVPAARTL